MSIAKRIISVVLAVIMAFGTMSVLGTVVSATHSFDSRGNTTLGDGDADWDAAFNPSETYKVLTWDDLMEKYNVPQDENDNYMPWKVDPFFYSAIEVYEFDQNDNEVETDHYVQPGQDLALYFYFKSNVGISSFTEAFLFDRTFFNINNTKKLTYQASNAPSDGLYNNGYYSGQDLTRSEDNYNPDSFIYYHQEFLDDGNGETLGVTPTDGVTAALTNLVANKAAPYSNSQNYYKINKSWISRFDVLTIGFDFAEEQYHPSCLTTYDPVGILDDPDYTYSGSPQGYEIDPNYVGANGIDPDAWLWRWIVTVRTTAEPFQGSSTNTVNPVQPGTVGHFGFDPVVMRSTHKSNKANIFFNPDPLGDTVEGCYEDKDYPGTVTLDFEDCNHTFIIGTPGSNYTVTFDVDGGTAIPAATVVSGSSITLPAAEKSGYTFLGWSVDDDGTADAGLGANASYTPSGNVTLHAIFQQQVVNYTVTYVVDGGTAINPDTVAAGGSVTLPTAVKGSLTFLGWSADDDGTADAGLGANATYTPAGNVTLYAIFAAPAAQYTVTFDANGGAPTPAAQTVDSGTQITAPTAPSKDHATFRAWTINGADVTFPYTVTGDVTMVAAYTAEQITVNFVTGAGATTVDPITADYGTQINKPTDPTKDNAVFTGWQINGVDVTWPYTLTADVVMTAVWDSVYTVTFDANGGAPTPTAVSGVAGTIVTEPTAPSKEHATFNGWKIDGEDVTFPYTITDDVTMVADYTVDTYTITFVVPAGATAVTAITDDYGTVYNDGDLPESELLGNDFLGWQINGTDVAYPYTLTGDVTMTAAFAPATISISWVDTDNVAYSVDASYTSQVYGGNLAIPADPAAPAQGLTFRGWSEDGVTFFKNGDTVAVPATDTTYKAYFTSDEYTVTFLDEGGNEIAAETLTGKYYGDVINLPDYTPFTVSDKFDGWTVEGDDSVYAAGDTYTVTGDTTFSAQVSTKQIDVTFLDANGDVYEIKTVEYGTSTDGLVPNAGNPTRDGGYFDSWDWNGATVITDEATATPIFIDEEYSIAFDSNSEDDVVTSFTFGDVFTQEDFEDIFADYIPEGYEVTEWQVGGVAVTFPYTVTDLGQNNAVVAVTTITTPIIYHIYYYVDGALESTLTQNLIIGDQITPQPLPNSPQSSGYNPGIAYDDWFSDASCQTVYTFPSNMGSSNITVYTQARLCAFDNAFHYLDGRIVYVTSTYTQAINTPNTDDPNTAPYDPWTPGFTGNRWNIQVNSQPNQTLDIYETSDGASLATYAINVYYYDLAEGNYAWDEDASVSYDIPYAAGTTVSVPDSMRTREGYVLDTEGSILSAELQLDTVTELEVYFDLGQYTLTIDDNNQLITDTLFYTEAIDLGTPAGKTGHSVDEDNPYTWTNAEGDEIEPQETMPAFNVTVTVNYVPNDYPLTVYINGEVDDTLSTLVTYGEPIEEVLYTPEAGYDFSGWKTDASLDTEYIFGEPMTEDGAEIYGLVTAHVYTIVYMVDGVEDHRADYAFDADVSHYEPTLAEGYDFNGWIPSEPAKMTIPEDGSDELVLNADVRPHVYNVVYYKEDGTVMKNAPTAFGTAPVPPTTNPTKLGNDFTGWEYDPALEEGGVIGAGEYTATPIFTPIDYTYTFYKTSGDTEAYATGTAAYGSEITAPADPDRGENYTFLGWKKVNASDNTPLETLTMDEVGGVSYVAIWEVNSDACFVKGFSKIAPEFYYTKGVAKYQVLVEQPARKLWIIDGNDGSRRPYDKASWLNNDGGVEYTGNDVPNSGIYNIVANADGSETWTIDGFYGAGTHQIYAVLPNGETDQANPYEFTIVYNEKTPAQVADDITSVTLKTTDEKDVPATGIVRGTDLVWTVTTSTDVTWLRFEGSYTADGEPKTVKTLYKYTATSDRVSVTDEGNVRTWVITMKFAYSASDLQITETWKLSYRLGTKSTYYQYKKAGDTTATEFQVIVGLNQEALEPVPVGYEKYQLVEVTPTASTVDLGRHEIKVKTTADCTKVRITVGTKKVCYQYSATNPSANVTFSTENDLLVWTISHNFNVAGENMTVKVETRGDAWTAQPYTYTVTVA